MELQNLFELYESQDDEGRAKIKEDFFNEYVNLSKQVEQLSDKNKKLQEINRNLIVNSQRPAEVENKQEQEKPPITAADLFEPITQKFML